MQYLQADLDDDDDAPLLMEGSMESPDSMPLKAYRQVLTSLAADSDQSVCSGKL